MNKVIQKIPIIVNILENLICPFCKTNLKKNDWYNDLSFKCENLKCMYKLDARFIIWIKNNEIYNYVIRFSHKRKYYTLVGRLLPQGINDKENMPYTLIKLLKDNNTNENPIVKVNYFIPLQMQVNRSYIYNLVNKLFKLKGFL